ncbi:SurA N-terminal domain-containing protein [Akkermansiaceae bacterium]|nr:SurA N-terminal domain-containing protein [Akkermansiaceae bacterium]
MNLLKTIFSVAFISSLSLVHAVEVTGIAAKVNGRVITSSELNFHLTPIREQVEASLPDKGPQYDKILKDARKKILNDLIERELILSEYQKLTNGSGLSPIAVDGEIKRQIKDNFNGNKTEFNQALRDAGLTPEKNREEVEKKLIVQAMRSQQFRNSVPPLPDEVSKQYNKLKLKMRDTEEDCLEYHKIYITKRDRQNPAINPEDQKALADAIVSKLEKGENFEELARKHSADSYASEGGKVTRTHCTDLAESFASILMNSPEGKVLGPLEDPHGYTIVRLDKKHHGPSPPLSDVRQQMEGRVRAEKNKIKLDRWIKRLHDDAMIEIK